MTCIECKSKNIIDDDLIYTKNVYDKKKSIHIHNYTCLDCKKEWQEREVLKED